jgi:hypothetical protein
MNEVVPPSAPDPAHAADPERCRQILLDILSSPALTNGEAEQASDYVLQGWSEASNSYFEAVLAAARWAYQQGDLQVVTPGLRLVK